MSVSLFLLRWSWCNTILLYTTNEVRQTCLYIFQVACSFSCFWQEFPWLHSAALGWGTAAAKNTVLPKQKRCCTDMLPVSGFRQPSFSMWIYFFFFWIQGDVLNPHKYRHINACKRTHTHTHNHPLLRALPPQKVPLWSLSCSVN